jgi:hypothetical protein
MALSGVLVDLLSADQQSGNSLNIQSVLSGVELCVGDNV